MHDPVPRVRSLCLDQTGGTHDKKAKAAPYVDAQRDAAYRIPQNHMVDYLLPAARLLTSPSKRASEQASDLSVHEF